MLSCLSHWFCNVVSICGKECVHFSVSTKGLSKYYVIHLVGTIHPSLPLGHTISHYHIPPQNNSALLMAGTYDIFQNLAGPLWWQCFEAMVQVFVQKLLEIYVKVTFKMQYHNSNVKMCETVPNVKLPSVEYHSMCIVTSNEYYNYLAGHSLGN